MALADTIQNMTPRQRIVAGVVAVCCAVAGATLAPFEGRVKHWYPDPVLGWNVPTVCDGHTGGVVDRSKQFSDADCDQLRNADLRNTYDGMLPCIGDIPMPDNELEAYLSFAFNVGPTAFCKSSIPAKLKAGNHAAACATLSEYRFVGGKDCAVYVHVCGGEVRRREAERSLCEGP